MEIFSLIAMAVNAILLFQPFFNQFAKIDDKIDGCKKVFESCFKESFKSYYIHFTSELDKVILNMLFSKYTSLIANKDSLASLSEMDIERKDKGEYYYFEFYEKINNFFNFYKIFVLIEKIYRYSKYLFFLLAAALILSLGIKYMFDIVQFPTLLVKIYVGLSCTLLTALIILQALYFYYDNEYKKRARV